MAAGKLAGALVGGLQHKAHADVQVEFPRLQHDDSGGKPIGFVGELAGAVAAEIVAHRGNQNGGSTDFRQHGFVQYVGFVQPFAGSL